MTVPAVAKVAVQTMASATSVGVTALMMQLVTSVEVKEWTMQLAIFGEAVAPMTLSVIFEADGAPTTPSMLCVNSRERQIESPQLLLQIVRRGVKW